MNKGLITKVVSDRFLLVRRLVLKVQTSLILTKKRPGVDSVREVRDGHVVMGDIRCHCRTDEHRASPSAGRCMLGYLSKIYRDDFESNFIVILPTML